MTVFLLLGGRRKKNSTRTTESQKIRVVNSEPITPEKHRSRKKQVFVNYLNNT